MALTCLLGLIGLVLGMGSGRTAPVERPNVILIMTDDQGYGDMSCHGNQILRTPHLDRLHDQSVRLSNFHVDPTCSPTRAALMTGRYSSRTGVWHTIMGRSLLRSDETSMADVFATNGYRTGIFGKWHLGDNYPLRPQDRGFEEVLVHGGGGVGQTPDYWGNDYFDDTYFHNGKPESFKGYCTEVFFAAALRFIEQAREAKRPFFCYLPTNVPHGPYRVPPEFSEPYVNQQVNTNFYGMIGHFDRELGRLLDQLKEWGLEENTILVFLTDNGTSAGADNAGMRGRKGSQYDGGHRVPCFIRWPGGDLGSPRTIKQLAAHIDLLPTLIELCRFPAPEGVAFDGLSLVPLLRGRAEWPERTLFVHSQRIDRPRKWKTCAVMTERWRLVDGRELYEMRADPGQQLDLAAQYPNVVLELRRAYEQWWDDLSRRFDEYVPIVIGADQENPAHLTCHDWHAPESSVPWDQTMIRRAPLANGFWAVEVAQPGRYQFILRRQPAQAPVPLDALRARLQVGAVEEERPVPVGAAEVAFEVELEVGPARLQTWLTLPDGRVRGAFFVEVRRLDQG